MIACARKLTVGLMAGVCLGWAPHPHIVGERICFDREDAGRIVWELQRRELERDYIRSLEELTDLQTTTIRTATTALAVPCPTPPAGEPGGPSIWTWGPIAGLVGVVAGVILAGVVWRR